MGRYGTTKITPEHLALIKRRRKDGVSFKDLAKLFPYSENTMARALRESVSSYEPVTEQIYINLTTKQLNFVRANGRQDMIRQLLDRHMAESDIQRRVDLMLNAKGD